jgi:hypothetical protein
MVRRKIRILILALLLLSFQTTIAQPRSCITIEGCKTFPTFRFIADGNTDNNGFRNRIDGAFNIGYQYDWKQGFILGADIGTYSAGATKKIDKLNYIWDLEYVRVKVKLGYVVNHLIVKPFVLVSPYYGYLAKASQLSGTSDYDLKEDNNLSLADFGIVATIGGKVRLSHLMQAFAAYNQNIGLLNIETNSDQKLFNRGFSLSFGLEFDIENTAATIKVQHAENQKQ